MSTLEVRDLEVEAGGKTVVEAPHLQPARRRQDGRRRPQRCGQDQHAQGARRRGARRGRHGAIRRGALGYLRQDPRQHREDDGITGLEYILGARDLVEMAPPCGEGPHRARGEPRRSATSTRFARAEEAYRDAGGYQAESEARTITAGLGLAQDRLALHVGALSGGERRRLELARILFGGSDLLLLDEPTNHLDADAKLGS